ncbi:MAG TPA: membrane protein insertase YidC [Bacteroidia bacterium]|jgi:YidC/Oxa1 family membrane protein insertase|nr:membrane protein insertase YidC [Bacteroidia bacterium]
MDRRTLIGFVIITGLLVIWMQWNSGSKEKEAAAQKRYNDSMAVIDSTNHAQAIAYKKKLDDSLKLVVAKDTSLNFDSIKTHHDLLKYGAFVNAHTGKDSILTIENEKIKASISTHGGKIIAVELKGIKTWDGKPLMLFTSDSTHFGLSFFDPKRIRFSTDSLYFKPIGSSFSVSGKESKSVTMRLYSDTSTNYVEYVYSLAGNSNMLDCKINFVGCNHIFADDQSSIDLSWAMKTPTQEKNLANERRVATVFYNFDGEETPENLNEIKDDKKSITGELKWVSFKQQYFSSILIANTKFANGGDASVAVPSDPFHVKAMSTTVPVPFNKSGTDAFAMKFYFGNNKYSDLKSYNLNLEREVYLGWSLFGGLNRYVFLPLFNWLGGSVANYGIAILLLTIIVKIILFPIAYKSYLSSAKMRVLKPEIEEITAKFKDDALKKQQATMALYKKAGVNPAAGCIPLLLQIPILFSLIRLFPAAYELRQQHFLWAHDLSTYDSVWNFGFSIPGYGDHMSLFALLMTVSTLLYTWMNQQLLSPTGPQLPGMKWLIYIMPLFFLSFLNSYSAALSYYYFVSNIITFTQMALMRRFVDEKAIHAKIEENKKKPVKQSGFMQRLEKAQRDRQKQLQEAQKNVKGGKKK